MTTYDRFELKMASLFIGCVQIMLSAIAVFGGEYDPLHRVLTERGTAGQFGVVMLTLGLMTVYGSARPKRQCRQIGLAFSSIVMLVIFGALMTGYWLTLTNMLILFLAIASLILFGADVRGKANAP